MFKYIFNKSDQSNSVINHFNNLNKELDIQEQLLKDEHLNKCVNQDKSRYITDDTINKTFDNQDHDHIMFEQLEKTYSDNQEEQRLKDIHNDLLQMNDMMNSMKDMVIEQGTTVETIEDSIMSSVLITDSGVEELEKAETYYSRMYAKRKRIASGAFLGGLLFSGVGSAFGMVQAMMAGGIGTGTGAFTGWLM